MTTLCANHAAPLLPAGRLRHRLAGARLADRRAAVRICSAATPSDGWHGAAKRGARRSRRTSRRRRSRSSTCSWPARRRSSTCSTTSRSCSSTTASRSRQDHLKGERFAFIKGTPRLLGSPFTFQQHGQSGGGDLRAAAAPREARRRHRDRPVDDDDAVQPRAGADLHEHRPPDHRPAEHGLVAHLRPRQREQGPAGFVVLMSGRTTRTAASRCWGSGFLPTRAPGRRVPLEGRAGAVLAQSGRASTPRARRESLDLVDELNTLAARATSATRRSTTRIAAYELAYRMQTSVPELTDVSSEPRDDPRDVRHRAGPGLVRQQLPARAAAGRARRAVRAALSPRAGTPRRLASAPTSSYACRGCACEIDRAIGALLTDLKQRGLLDTRWSSGAASSAARRSTRRGTARSCSAATTIRARSRCGWPAAASSRASPSGAPTSSATTSSRIRSTSTTCTRRSCTCWASTTRS